MTREGRTGRCAVMLCPSEGLGGGIERVGVSIQRSIPGIRRFDLYGVRDGSSLRHRTTRKVTFAGEAIVAALRVRPGLVICLHVGLLSVAHAVARVAGRSPVVVAHGTEVWGALTPARRALINGCERVLAVSAFTAEEVIQRSGIVADRVNVVPLAIDERLARIARSTKPSVHREPVVKSCSISTLALKCGMIFAQCRPPAGTGFGQFAR